MEGATFLCLERTFPLACTVQTYVSRFSLKQKMESYLTESMFSYKLKEKIKDEEVRKLKNITTCLNLYIWNK